MTLKPDSFRRRALAVCLGAACALGVPVLTRADRPATRPAGEARGLRDADESDRKGGHRREEHERRFGRGGDERSDDGRDGGKEKDKDRDWDRDRDGKGRREPTAQEWEEIATFMLKHSPNKWRMVELIPDRHDLKGRAKAGIAHRYRELQSLKSREPERYELELERVQVEDEIFGLLGGIRKENKDAGRAQVTDEQKERLREKVRKLWELRAADREMQVPRIRRQLSELRLSGTVAALEEEMAADKLPETRDRWVEDRVNSFLGRSGFGGGPGGYGGYGGPGRPGRP